LASTILLFRHVIGPLTNPIAYGGTAADAFDVVIPSLPGFAFSEKPAERGWNAERVARAWAVLMQRLGYRRYVAQGGDWGAFVTTAMAQQHAPGLAAIHLNFAQTIPDEIPAELLPDQKRAVDAVKAFREKGSGYLDLQSTRPQLVGYALADSPVGQAAWIYDIFNSGTGATGRPEDAVSRDDMSTRSHYSGSPTQQRPLRASTWSRPRAWASTKIRGVLTFRWASASSLMICRLRAAGRSKSTRSFSTGANSIAAATSRRWRSPNCSPKSCAAASIHYATLDRLTLQKENL
jgi:pimeloyl-ACP methyl ester carboxylesterase